MKKIIKFVIIANVLFVSCNKSSIYNTKKKANSIVKYVDRGISTKDYDDETLLNTSELVLHQFTKEDSNTNSNFLAYMDLNKNRLFLSKKVKPLVDTIFTNTNCKDSNIKIFIMKDKILVKNLLKNNYLPVYGGKEKGRKWEHTDYEEIKEWKMVFETFEKIEVKKEESYKKKKVKLYKELVQEYKKFKKAIEAQEKDNINQFMLIKDHSLDSSFNSSRKYPNSFFFKNNNDHIFNNSYIYDEKDDILTNFFLRNKFSYTNICNFRTQKFNLDYEVFKLVKFSDEELKLFVELYKNEFFQKKSLIIEKINKIAHSYYYEDFKSDYFTSGEWIMILPEHILKVAEDGVPKQVGGKSDWTCGPNTAARALIILYYGQKNFKYGDIVNCCPKYVCTDTLQSETVE